MDKKMIERIKKQLSIRSNKLYCMHNKDKPCAECMKNIWGDVSNISGYVSNISGYVSNIRGDVSNISGSVNEIKKILTR